MPEDKKGHHKGKSDPKEQRRPRQRHQAGPVEKKNEKKNEDPKPIQESKVSVPKKPPTYEDPGPEFYKNLKRETDEILKITEEANTKYKKKEIQSNWTKYEMPIESYEEIEEQENLGADYEKLIQAPLSIGGHFQFKHEKSWDVSTDPSMYDKYFDINMDKLSIALSTIPFYERNSLDLGLFNETDILTMNNRSTKFKQKYYNDKSYSTPETEAQERILRSLCKSDDNDETKDTEQDPEEKRSVSESEDIKLETNIVLKTENTATPNIPAVKDEINVIKPSPVEKKPVSKMLDTFDDILENVDPKTPENEIEIDKLKVSQKLDSVENKKNAKPIDKSKNKTVHVSEKDDLVGKPTQKVTSEPVALKTEIGKVESVPVKVAKTIETAPDNKTKNASPEKETKKNPVIESPEDLEKWLDDFLDG